MTAHRLIRWLAPAPAAALPRFDPADFEPALQTRLLVLQPTPFCNLDCDYCYLPHRDDRARMPLATARQAAQRLLDDGLAGPRLTVVWHAGEPMVLPPSYYEDAFGTLAEVLAPHCALDHAMQTNATRIDDRWCALLRRWSVQVGVSVDGPAWLHDRHRHTRRGDGTHGQVTAGMARLHAAGIRFHAIAVVTADTLAAPEAFVDYFEGLGITGLGCNIDEAEGLHARSSLSGHEAAHAALLQRLLSSRLPVRELDTARHLIAEALPRYRWHGHRWPDNAQVLPFAIVSVAHDGGFSCFSPELLGQAAPRFGDFVFGHVQQTGYLAAAQHPAFVATWQAIVQGIAACERDCAHFGYCGGGAPANKLYELGTFAGTETLYCRSMLQRPFDAVLAQAEHTLAAGIAA